MWKLCWEPRLNRLELSGNRESKSQSLCLFWSFLYYCLLSSLLNIIIYRHTLSCRHVYIIYSRMLPCRHVRIIYRYMMPKYFQSWHSPASEHLLSHFHMVFYNSKTNFFWGGAWTTSEYKPIFVLKCRL